MVRADNDLSRQQHHRNGQYLHAGKSRHETRQRQEKDQKAKRALIEVISNCSD